MEKTPDFMSIAVTYLFATGASLYFVRECITEYESLLGCIFFGCTTIVFIVGFLSYFKKAISS